MVQPVFFEAPDNGTDDVDENHRDASRVIVLKEKSSSGRLSDFIIRQMVHQCDGKVDPALHFYVCIENSTHLPTVWAAMGLNATLMRLRTVDSTFFLGNNLTQQQNTFITLFQPATLHSQNAPTPQELFSRVGAQSNNLCKNVDGLVSCLNPYLSACFPDGESDNDVPEQSKTLVKFQNQTGMDGASSIVTDTPDSSNTTTTSSDDEKENNSDGSFFAIPFLQTQSQIFPLLQQAFSILCSNQAIPFKGLIDSTLCLLRSVDQADLSCRTSCQNVPMEPASSNTNATPMSSFTKTDAQTCSALQDCVECQLENASETCGPAVANTIQTVLQFYLNALQCYPDANVNSIRPPFNAGVL